MMPSYEPVLVRRAELTVRPKRLDEFLAYTAG